MKQYFNPPYETAVKQYNEIVKTLERYENLFKCGIPYMLVHEYSSPTLPSGFKNGEKIIVKCGAKLIEEIDNVNRNNARYGTVYIDFGKRDNLRKYINICSMKNDMTKPLEQRLQVMKMKKKFEKDFLIIEKSKLADGMVGLAETAEKEDTAEQEKGLDGRIQCLQTSQNDISQQESVV